jgi:hypothetical protein
MKNLGKLLITGATLFTIGLLALGTGYTSADQPALTAGQPAITAIDILLLPDDTMVQHAQAVNQRLLKVFPQGFSLDASHRPHISMYQCYVRTADLNQVFAVADKVMANGNITALKLEAFKYYYIPDKTLGLSGIVVKVTPQLLKLQADLIAAVSPLTVKTATAAAFYTTPENPDISPIAIHYVEVFPTEHAGKYFEPHVTTGVAPTVYLDKMLAEPFEDFTFSPAGAAVYHIGQYGTAARKLADLKLNP